MSSMREQDAAPVKRSRGRPEGVVNKREAILDAAEEVFAEAGYAGTSLRDIVERANVTKGLVNYYFGSKENLFQEVFLRRGAPIAAKRLERLAELTAREDRALTLQDLVRAFLQPSIQMPRTDSALRFFRIQARLHMEQEEFAYSLRRKLYEESTLAYARAIQSVAPHLSEKTVYWRLILMVGANLYAVSDTHRINELSGSKFDAADQGELLDQVTAFVCGGFAAPDPSPEHNAASAPKRRR